MIGDDRLYSQKITRTTEQGGRIVAGWCTGVGPVYPKQLGFGPCKSVKVIGPTLGVNPSLNNQFNIQAGDSNHQPLFISPGLAYPIECDRLDYVWVIRAFDWSLTDNTTLVNIGYIINYDPPSEPYEATGLDGRYYQPNGLSFYERAILEELRRIAGPRR